MNQTTPPIQPPPPPYQVQPQKSSSGCLPFFMGCLTGVFVSMLLLGAVIGGGIYLSGHLIDKYATSFYYKEIRPEIETSSLRPDQKQYLLRDMDALADRFPDMTLAEKKQALQEIFENVQKIETEKHLKQLQKQPPPSSPQNP